MSFDAGKFVNNLIGKISSLGNVSSKNNTREAEKNMQAQQFFTRFDSPDEDLQIDTKRFQNNLKYAIPTNFDEGEYADTLDDNYKMPEESVKKYAVPELIREKLPRVQTYYGIQIPPRDEPIEEPEVQTDYGVQIAMKYAHPPINEPEIQTDYGVQVKPDSGLVKYGYPSIEPDPTQSTEPIYEPLYGAQIRPEPTYEPPVLKYAVPSPEPTQKPTPSPGGGAGGVGSRQNNPWRRNLTEIFTNIFNRTTTSFYDRMSEVFNRVFSRSRR